MIVCLFGYSGSGKSTVADYLITHVDHLKEVIEVSSIVKQFSKSTDLGSDTVKNEKLWQAILAEIADGSVVIGLREDWMYHKLKESMQQFDVKVHGIYLQVDEKERYERMKKTRGTTVLQFCAKDQTERQIGLTELLLNNDLQVITHDWIVSTYNYVLSLRGQ